MSATELVATATENFDCKHQAQAGGWQGKAGLIIHGDVGRSANL